MNVADSKFSMRTESRKREGTEFSLRTAQAGDPDRVHRGRRPVHPLARGVLLQLRGFLTNFCKANLFFRGKVSTNLILN